MKKILVLVSSVAPEKSAGLFALVDARGFSAEAVLPQLGSEPNADALKILASVGVNNVHVLVCPEGRFEIRALGSALEDLRSTLGADGVIANTDWDSLGAVVWASRKGRGIVVDRVRDLQADGDALTVTSEIFAGQFLRTDSLAAGNAFYLLFSGSLTPVALNEAAAAPKLTVVKAPDSGVVVTKIEEAEKTDGISLPKAPLVFALGDGAGRKGVDEVKQIIAILKARGVPAALGGTRVIVDAGLISRHGQIGVSGIAVTPKLLVSVGASGAPQHWSGIRDAGKIIALNSDAEAPLMKVADHPIQGDAKVFLKSLREKLAEGLTPEQRETLSKNAHTATTPNPQTSGPVVVSNDPGPLPDQPLHVDLRSLEFDGFEVFRIHELDPAWNREKLAGLLRKAGRYAETRLNQGKRRAEHLHCQMLPGEENREHAIVTPPGLKEAFQEYYKGGFGRFNLPRKFGGLETPHGFIDMVSEIVNGGSVAMGTAYELTGGASIILQNFGTDWMKETVLPGLHDGRFQGTMCLTEAQAGSDLGAVNTVAERIPGTDRFAVKGTKIFITSGDHDMASNFIHIVLAKIQGVAQKGTGAISLFLVPKFKLDEQGQGGEFNNVITQSLEHKHGMTTSPTVVLKFDGSEGILIARDIEEEMRQPSGMKMMFFFMNYMRHETGTAARGQAMATCLDALEYNNERIQGMSLRDAMLKQPIGPIFRHAGQRKALLDMFARTLAGRALTLRLTEIRDHAEKDLESELHAIKKERAELPLSAETRVIIAKLEAEIANFDRRFRKGEAAKKMLAKDPEGLARNEQHLKEVGVELASLRQQLAQISSGWVKLNERLELAKMKRKDEDNYALILTSLVKAQVTDDNIRTLNEGMQSYGGLGFMDEVPISQRLRDSQVLCIWEGTNDIQALNTVGRQIGNANTDSKGVVVWNRLMSEIKGHLDEARKIPELANAAALLLKCQAELQAFRDVLAQATQEAQAEIATHLQGADVKVRFGELVNASARNFNTWFAQLAEAAMLMRTALIAYKLLQEKNLAWDADFLQGRLWLTAHFALSPNGVDKSVLAWREWFWNNIPWDLERKHLADAPERILA